MSLDPSWIAVGFTSVGMLGTGLLAVDNWVHKQGADDTTVRREVRDIQRQLRGLRRMITKANDDASRRNTQLQNRLSAFEIEITRLKAFEESRHFHERRTDTP